MENGGLTGCSALLGSTDEDLKCEKPLKKIIIL
jgi:hypothetical protein